MEIKATSLAGVLTVTPALIEDQRGGFGRTFCSSEFRAAGLVPSFVQSSTAFTRQSGTLRGLHYQRDPHWETKLVRCTRGAAFVVAVDIRPDSTQHKQWIGIELSADNRVALYVPVGFAQGYQTLADETELLYQMDKHYDPPSATGYAFDDPAFGIEWPLAARNLSDKDQNWKPYNR